MGDKRRLTPVVRTIIFLCIQNLTVLPELRLSPLGSGSASCWPYQSKSPCAGDLIYFVSNLVMLSKFIHSTISFTQRASWRRTSPGSTPPASSNPLTKSGSSSRISNKPSIFEALSCHKWQAIAMNISLSKPGHSGCGRRGQSWWGGRLIFLANKPTSL
jgi:hypothetical protein